MTGCETRKHNGFTLVEVLVSITILAVIMVPLFTLLGTTRKLSGYEEDYTAAAFLAQEVMEEARCKLYHHPKSSLRRRVFSAPFNRFSCLVTEGIIDNENDLSELTVKVSKDKRISVTVKCLISRREASTVRIESGSIWND